MRTAKIERHLNVRLIELAIIERNWTWTEAALRLEIDRETLKRIRAKKNVHNKIIKRLSEKLCIAVSDLVVWPTDDENLSTRQNVVASGRITPGIAQDPKPETGETTSGRLRGREAAPEGGAAPR